MNRLFARAAGALLVVVAAFCMAPVAHAATESEEATGRSEYWWRDAPNHAALEEALAEYGLDTNSLERDPVKALKRTEDWGDPLHWLASSVRTYGQAFANNGVYHIPVTEQHAGGMKRRATFGRAAHFVTRTNADASVRVSAVNGIPQGVGCYVGVITDFSPNSLQEIALPSTGKIAPPPKVGTVVLRCQDLNENLPNAGKDVAIRVETSSAHTTEMFVFGVVTKASWKTNVSQQNAALGRVFLHNGRTRFLVPKARAVAAADIDIMDLMREHLEITLSYDRVNGYGGPSGDVLDLAPTDLVSANYGECCWASPHFGSIGIGGNNYPLSTTSWLDWHEYGHLYQTDWDKFFPLTEVTVNLYSLAACRALRNDPPIKTCHPNSTIADLTWDPQAVPNFIKSGVKYEFDAGGPDVLWYRMRIFAQLFTTYDGIFAKLGKEYRHGYNRGKGPLASYSQEQLRDWFVVNTSKAAGRDLRAYYRQWGLGFSASADAQVQALNLPPADAFAYEFTGTFRPDVVSGNIGSTITDPRATTVGLVALRSAEGPTQLLSYGDPSGSTLFTVPVTNEFGKTDRVYLKGQRRVGNCAPWIIHSSQGCSGPATTLWNIAYLETDNLHLTPGNHYKGILELNALDIELPAWKGRVTIHLDIPAR